MSEEQYFIRVRGRVQGPFDIDRLHLLAKRGQFSRLHEVSSDGTAWSRASDHPELFPSPAETARRVPVGTRSPEAAAPNAAAPPEPALEWFYSRDGSQLGPVALNSLSALLAAGQLCRDDMVWKAGLPSWLPLSEVVPAGGPSQGAAPPIGPGERRDVRSPRRFSPAMRAALLAAVVIIPLGMFGMLVMGLGVWWVFRSGGTDEVALNDGKSSAQRSTPRKGARSKPKDAAGGVSTGRSSNSSPNARSANQNGDANDSETDSETLQFDAVADAPEIGKAYKPFVVLIETRWSCAGGSGSGIIIANSRTTGLILTNRHVIDLNYPEKSGEPLFGELHVKVASETARHPVTLVAIHRSLDLALLALDRSFSHERAVTFVSRDAITQGEGVVALGNPLGVEFAISEGIVMKVDDAEILTDCTINSGNSGGPLILKRRGLVAGINTKSRIRKADGSPVQQFNYAICTDQALSPRAWVRADKDAEIDDLMKRIAVDHSGEN